MVKPSYLGILNEFARKSFLLCTLLPRVIALFASCPEASAQAYSSDSNNSEDALEDIEQ